jgi:hypothetical protein
MIMSLSTKASNSSTDSTTMQITSRIHLIAWEIFQKLSQSLMNLSWSIDNSLVQQEFPWGHTYQLYIYAKFCH